MMETTSKFELTDYECILVRDCIEEAIKREHNSRSIAFDLSGMMRKYSYEREEQLHSILRKLQGYGNVPH